MQYPDKKRQATGTLYLVATPIGNLSDISERAVRTLRESDFIAAEDTRVTRKLLGHLGIKKPLLSYRSHNRFDAGEKILARVLEGESCALVSDAGTPSISDPGEDLVRLFIQSDVPVKVIPGPCAAVAGLALSGLPTGSFVFEGFLPHQKAGRRAVLREMQGERRTMVFYEAPHRLQATLIDMLEVFGDRHISVSREITKVFEETLHMTLGEAAAHFSKTPPRGEFVLVVEGRSSAPSDSGKLDEAVEMASELIDNGLSASDAVKKAARITGCSKNELYESVVRGIAARRPQ